MEKNFEKFDGGGNEPRNGLLETVMARINEEKRRAALKKRIALFSVCAVVSLTSCIPVSMAAWTDLSESGFAQFVSLAFSDPEAVLASWNDFALSVVESLPVTNITMLLGTLFAFLGSLKLLSRDMTAAFSPSGITR